MSVCLTLCCRHERDGCYLPGMEVTLDRVAGPDISHPEQNYGLASGGRVERRRRSPVRGCHRNLCSLELHRGLNEVITFNLRAARSPGQTAHAAPEGGPGRSAGPGYGGDRRGGDGADTTAVLAEPQERSTRGKDAVMTVSFPGPCMRLFLRFRRVARPCMGPLFVSGTVGKHRREVSGLVSSRCSGLGRSPSGASRRGDDTPPPRPSDPRPQVLG